MSRQFQFFVHGNFNLLTAILITAISILLTAISIYSRQFLQFYSRQFQFFHDNARGIFRFSHHLSATAADSGHAPKVKRKINSGYLKSIFKEKSENHKSKVDYELAELGGIYVRLGRTQTGMSSYRSPYISFQAFTALNMNSDWSDFISVADPTRVTVVPV